MHFIIILPHILSGFLRWEFRDKILYQLQPVMRNAYCGYPILKMNIHSLQKQLFCQAFLSGSEKCYCFRDNKSHGKFHMIVSEHLMDEITGNIVSVVTTLNCRQLRWMWCFYGIGDNKYAYRIWGVKLIRKPSLKRPTWRTRITFRHMNIIGEEDGTDWSGVQGTFVL
jgi:hypothetical protein